MADIDLTSFGPYHGDVDSSLGEFEASMRRCREIDARWYGTSHQNGVIDGVAEFRRRLDAFTGVVEKRDAALLAFLGEPRTVAEIGEHRLVYRPYAEGPQVGAVLVAGRGGKPLKARLRQQVWWGALLRRPVACRPFRGASRRQSRGCGPGEA
ncbi:hypothetical protein ACIBK8_08605 [Streptomyces sp. NPDC050161]|uniref:hypothetical protein n=1 Tax=Streptomyces sp. NPDC050161 TaxID=3365604 RepID=UPI003796BEF3